MYIVESSEIRTAYCVPNGVLITEVSLYRTAYCCPNGVLIIEVSLYGTAYCGPIGVLITEVSLYIYKNIFTQVYAVNPIFLTGLLSVTLEFYNFANA